MTERFEVHDTPLADLKLVRRSVMNDKRGYLERIFCEHELRDLMNGERIVQLNRTLTLRRGTVRGMHFQHPPYSEIKLVTCVRGRVFDVAIDLRFGSATFLCWHGEILDADRHVTLVIPKGFAHGFQTLTDDCELLYMHTAAYREQAEGAVNARDPRIGIAWPQPFADLSARDESHQLLTDDFVGLVI